VLNRLPNDLLMAEVNAVEHPDGDAHFATERVQLSSGRNDSHWGQRMEAVCAAVKEKVEHKRMVEPRDSELPFPAPVAASAPVPRSEDTKTCLLRTQKLGSPSAGEEPSGWKDAEKRLKATADNRFALCTTRNPPDPQR